MHVYLIFVALLPVKNCTQGYSPLVESWLSLMKPPLHSPCGVEHHTAANWRKVKHGDWWRFASLALLYSIPDTDAGCLCSQRLKLLESWLSKTQTRARLVVLRAKHIILTRAFLSQTERLGWRSSAIIQVIDHAETGPTTPCNHIWMSM